MYGIDYELNKTKRKIFRGVWLVFIIALGTTIGNVVSHSFNNWNDERKLKLALEKAEKESVTELKNLQKEIHEKQLRENFLAEEEKNKREQQYMDLLDKKAECEYWIEKSKLVKTSEAINQRMKICKEAGKPGY